MYMCTCYTHICIRVHGTSGLVCVHPCDSDTYIYNNATLIVHKDCIPCTIGHRCSVSGCGETIVIDGNMKNHRDVCLATEAGYVEYLGLPGRVKTGCANTPDFKSRFCSLHKPTATVTRQENADIADAHVTGNQVGVILHKKSTRAQTFYHVCKQDIHTYMRHEVLIIMFMYM